MTYLLSGNIFHGSMGLDQLFTQRPSYSAPAYSSPVSGLYLCGSGAHPGKIWNSQGAPMRGDNFFLCELHMILSQAVVLWEPPVRTVLE